MTPEQLLELTPLHTRGIYSVLPLIPEVGYVDDEKAVRATLRVYADPYLDGIRSWVLCSLFFDDRPVMIIQLAGRHNKDHRKRFIVDVNAYKEMVLYLMVISLEEEDILYEEEVVPLTEELPEMTCFYGREFISKKEE